MRRRGADFGLRIPRRDRGHARRPGEEAEDHRRICRPPRPADRRRATSRLVRSYARFLDPHTVALDDGGRLRAAQFLVATGSRVSVPAGSRPGGRRRSGPATTCWISTSGPASVLVLGGGIVACELAQFLQPDRHAGDAWSSAAASILRNTPGGRRGSSSRPSGRGDRTSRPAPDPGVARGRGGMCASFRHAGQPVGAGPTISSTRSAASPTTHGLGLAAAGVQDRAQRAGSSPTGGSRRARPNIYAAGDCCGPHRDRPCRHPAGRTGGAPRRRRAGPEARSTTRCSSTSCSPTPSWRRSGWQRARPPREGRHLRSRQLPLRRPRQVDPHERDLRLCEGAGRAPARPNPRGGDRRAGRGRADPLLQRRPWPCGRPSSTCSARPGTTRPFPRS